MVCPNCGHVYPIANGIPNMVRRVCAPNTTDEINHSCTQLLAEHEIA